jgi:hypothetical protein
MLSIGNILLSSELVSSEFAMDLDLFPRQLECLSVSLRSAVMTTDSI